MMQIYDKSTFFYNLHRTCCYLFSICGILGTVHKTILIRRERTGMQMKKPSFRFNLYSMFIFSVLIPFALASLTFTLYYNYIIKKQDAQNISNILTSVSQNIRTRLGELGTISTTCYMHSNIMDSMKSLNDPEQYSYYYDRLELNRLENDYTIAMTKLMFTSQQAIYNISFFPVAKDSDFFYSLGKSSAGIKRIRFQDYQNQEWYLDAVAHQGDLRFYPAHVPYYLGEDNTPFVFSAVKLIVDMDSKKHVGILKIDSKLSNLENILTDITVESGSHLVIVDADGHSFVGNDDFLPTIQTAAEPSRITLDDSRYQMNPLPLAGTEWNLIYLSNTRSESIRILLSIFLSLAGMGVGIVIAFIIYRSRSVTLIGSITNITDTIHQFEQGNLKARSHVDSEHELKTISDELNTMADKMDAHIQKEYIAVINQQKAEYKALQSQINPHFLYNTLNGFIALNRMGEQKKLEKSILHLTHLFRYTCHPEDTTMISNEFGFLEEYLSLQKLKYDDRLEFGVSLSPDCRDFLIPKLLLQPIVENSIIHGLEPTNDTIRVDILCQPLAVKGIGEMVLILILDNGVGYDPLHPKNAGASVGLSNVEERVALFIPGSLCYTSSAPGCGTKTLFLFPHNRSERSYDDL